MDKELKKKWVNALRSGKYLQGTGHLRSRGKLDQKYCCLGVLCDIAPGIKYDNAISAFKSDEYGMFSSELLPPSVAKEFGLLKRVQLDKEHQPLQDKLANLNDRGISFNAIADYIEKVL